MEAQQGECAICRTPMLTPHADHDHERDSPRGLLCRLCNTMLGMARDQAGILRAGADYLERYAVVS